MSRAKRPSPPEVEGDDPGKRVVVTLRIPRDLAARLHRAAELLPPVVMRSKHQGILDALSSYLDRLERQHAKALGR